MFKVAKFGGSSMADKVGFRRVAEWIRNDEDIKAVVVSAGGKTANSKKVTDLLLDASTLIFRGEGIKKSLNQFIERVLLDAKAIGLENFIDDELMKIEQEVEKDLSLDFILSRGEYCYAKLFSKYYGLPFVDSATLIGFYEDGKINFGLSEFQISRAYAKYGRFVCGGFYGALPNGKIKTFTRGGGDFSGAIVAKGLKAQEYLNFTDVDGIFSFSPSLGKSEPIKEISFDTVRLLGEFGLSVLHPASVLPLYGTDAKIIVKNTFNKNSSGTVIKEKIDSEPFAFAIKRNCYFIKMVKRGNGYTLNKSIYSEENKIICTTVSLDFVEVCLDGKLDNNFTKGQGLDFCQIHENVTVLYFTPCAKSVEAVCCLKKQILPLIVCSFDCGLYLVLKREDEEKALEIILKN